MFLCNEVALWGICYICMLWLVWENVWDTWAKDSSRIWCIFCVNKSQYIQPILNWDCKMQWLGKERQETFRLDFYKFIKEAVIIPIDCFRRSPSQWVWWFKSISQLLFVISFQKHTRLTLTLLPIHPILWFALVNLLTNYFPCAPISILFSPSFQFLWVSEYNLLFHLSVAGQFPKQLRLSYLVFIFIDTANSLETVMEISI